ncbi:hypothetical protein INR49_023453 [Caranx melampygus]|nr:hypothetical protein INR49_023453 [Caranx melampygus]
MLIGPNAPLAFERGLRGTHMQHAYDFYKPDLVSEYPVVDGKLSIECYLSALDRCYSVYRNKIHAQWQREVGGDKRVVLRCTAVTQINGSEKLFSLEDFGYLVFHSPYCKLVQKSLARLMLNDFLSHPSPNTETGPFTGLDAFRDIRPEETYFDRDVEKAFMKASADLFERKTKPPADLQPERKHVHPLSLRLPGLTHRATYSLTDSRTEDRGFLYGSGFAATLYSLRVTQDHTPGSGLDKLVSSLSDLKVRLDSRTKVSPAAFSENMKLREETHHLASYVPRGSVDDLFPGTWYLTRVDDKHRREYARRPLSHDLPAEPDLVRSTTATEHIPSPAKKMPRIPAASSSPETAVSN